MFSSTKKSGCAAELILQGTGSPLSHLQPRNREFKLNFNNKGEEAQLKTLLKDTHNKDLVKSAKDIFKKVEINILFTFMFVSIGKSFP